MSSDLFVKISGPIENDLLLSDSAQAFKDLMNVEIDVPFHFRDTGTIVLVGTDFGTYFDILEIEAQPPWITAEEAGTYAGGTCSGSEALPWAVTASVALALARRYQTNISDSGSRWVKFAPPLHLDNQRGCSAIIFQQAVANRHKFSAIEPAANEFYNNLPVLVEDPGWMKRKPFAS